MSYGQVTWSGDVALCTCTWVSVAHRVKIPHLLKSLRAAGRELGLRTPHTAEARLAGHQGFLETVLGTVLEGQGPGSADPVRGGLSSAPGPDLGLSAAALVPTARLHAGVAAEGPSCLDPSPPAGQPAHPCPSPSLGHRHLPKGHPTHTLASPRGHWTSE